MTKTQTLVTLPILGALMLIGGGIAGYASITNADAGEGSMGQGMMARMGKGIRAPHVAGTITTISGSTLSITAEANHGGGTYTIDASSATIMKDGAEASLSSFKVGDRVMAEGTIEGTNVKATKIGSRMGKGFGGRGGHGKGHGVMGEVTAVAGATITVKGMDGTSYTVNAGAAKVQKMAEGTLSDIAVGDRIGVQGSVSGTTVTATTIMDNLPTMPINAQ